MTTLIIAFSILTIVIGALSFFMSESLVIALITSTITIIYVFGVAGKRIQKSQAQISNTRQCYAFINQFIITLSVHESISATYNHLQEQWPPGVRKHLDDSGILDPFQNLMSLQNYFTSKLYRVFLDLLNIYKSEGGDIIKISDYLLAQVRLGGEVIENLLTLVKKKFAEISSLWIMSFIVLIAAKYAIGDIYEIMIKNPIFLVFIVGYFLIFLFAFHLFLNQFYSLSMEVNNNEV